MTKKLSTKRALLTNVLAMLLCIAMLLGTTFAWFTDSASTGVNKIEAGTLQIGLETKDAQGRWVNAEVIINKANSQADFLSDIDIFPIITL